MTSSLDKEFPLYRKNNSPKKTPTKPLSLNCTASMLENFTFSSVLYCFPPCCSVLLDLCMFIVDKGPLFQDHI